MARGTLGQLLHQFRKLIAAGPAALADGTLLERFVTRQDEEAFTLLVQRHGPMVLNVCRRVLQDGHAAEDAFQATFLVFVRRASSLDRTGSLANWLYTVAYHIALRARADAARRRSRERQVEDMPCGEPTGSADWQELRPLLDEELNRLPDKYRAPLALCYLEGMTNEQAARELGWAIGSMSKRLARGRELLRARLTRRGVAISTGLLGTVLANHALAEVLPATLVTAAVRAALLFAAGEAVAGAISAPAVSLAEGTLQTLGTARLKIAVVMLLLAAGATGTAAAVFLHPKPTEPPIVAARPPGLAEPPALAQPREEALPPPRAREIVPPELVVTARQRNVLKANGLSVTALAFSLDGTTLVSGNGDKRSALFFWDVASGQRTERLNVHASEVRAVAFAANGAQLASASRDKTAKLLDPHTGADIRVLRGHGGSVYAVAFAPVGLTVATGSSDKTVRLWDRATGEVLATLDAGEGVLALAFVPKSAMLVAGSRDKAIKVWNWMTHMPITTLRGHADIVTTVAASPDGKTLASGSKDRTVKLWSLRPELRERHTLRSHTAGIACIAFAPDGQTLATASDDGSVKLWDVATGKEWTTLPAHRGGVSAVAFAPDGRTLATGGVKDMTIKLWDIAKQPR